MSYRNVHFALILLVACSLGASAARAFDDCSDGGCPSGQRCVGDGKSPILKCVPEPPRIIGSVGESKIAHFGPGHSSHGPHQGPDCYADSDCRIGYTCGKGDLDPNSPGYATLPGNCGRTEPACRQDADCLSDEFCDRGPLIDNPTHGICQVRPTAAQK